MLATRFGHKAQNNAIRSNRPLSESELARVAPSIFAEAPHASRSARYAHIPTVEVLRGLSANGFAPFFACQATVRDESGRGFTKHMLRLRHSDQITQRDDTNEVILINSHNGSSSYQMLAGCFRFVCANGMVCGTTQADVRVKHSGNAVEEVVRGAFGILSGFGEVDASKDAFKSLLLSDGEQRVFAEAALAVRFGTEKQPPVRADQVLQPRRQEDAQGSLWNVFQRAQEHLVQGGLRTNDRRRRTNTRAVNGIDGNVALNRGLWVLAERMRELKAA